ncbi:MAG: hypothetical protein M1834_009459 [Cirrosporium novae-zelandiae]|nr:MAG: hypothetical protein M1834_009459 [Cirrosporium novae-zelandiae]
MTTLNLVEQVNGVKRYDLSSNRIIGETIEHHRAELKVLNYLVYRNPELCYEEHKAHDACVELLVNLGFKVTPHAYGIPTSFEAEYAQGSGGRVLVFNAEYDSLPGIGHACGHNLIAIASFAAFLGAAEQLKVSKISGRVRLLGTPAEEGGGGKIALINHGAYKSVDACLIAHPAPLYRGYGKEFNAKVYLQHNAIDKFTVAFSGKNAHAAASPWEGRNALDAAVMAYNAISMLRQQTHPDFRIHGVIINGGVKENIIPDYSALEYAVRAPSLEKLRILKQRVVDCFEAAATATACTVEITDGILYADMRPNKTICSVFTEESAKINYPVYCDFVNPSLMPASTDQGNVSYIVPAFQPSYGIPAGPGCANHTIGFHDAAGTEEAFNRTLTIGKSLAATAWKILSDDTTALKMKKDFEEDRSQREALGILEGEKELIYRWNETIMKGGNNGSRKCSCGHQKA